MANLTLERGDRFIQFLDGGHYQWYSIILELLHQRCCLVRILKAVVREVGELLHSLSIQVLPVYHEDHLLDVATLS